MKKTLLITLAFLITSHIWAGRYAGDFLEIGAGVRALGLGGTYTAIADDGSAIYWNSSGISQIRKTEINIMRAYLYKDIHFSITNFKNIDVKNFSS